MPVIDSIAPIRPSTPSDIVAMREGNKVPPSSVLHGRIARTIPGSMSRSTLLTATASSCGSRLDRTTSRLHPQLVFLCPDHQPAYAYHFSYHTRRWRWRPAAQRTGDSGRHLLRQATQHGLCHVWNGGRRRARHWPNTRRLANGQLQLTLDIPHQRAHRYPLTGAHTARGT